MSNWKTGLAMLLAASLVTAANASTAQPQSKQVLSDVYTIEKKYLSMEGPASLLRVHLGDPAKPEVVWLTAIRTEVVGEDGKTPASPELMCHLNVDLDAQRHQTLFKLKRTVQSRLVTVSQGMSTAPGIYEARVPKGFGFPLASNEALLVYTQVLNLNIDNPANIKVRHRVTFEYLRDQDLKEPIKPLFNLAASGMVILQDNPLAIPMTPPPAASGSSGLEVGGGGHGATCLVLPRAPNAAGMNSDYVDPSGRRLTGHWVVPPGRQVNHSDVSWFLGLPYDVTVHYAAVHLHPFAKSLALKDAKTGKTIFEAKAKSPEGRLGLEHVDSYASSTGFRLKKNAQYQLISVYDNPLDRNVDSMASMFFGAVDPEFVKPTPAELASRATEYAI
ncbi:MAG TPA: hypothetical protein VFL80_06235, partial [Thermoanaerobaculia bacterium]|nr:hypothetical protein [Thermoanaerobaculia bacterium]